MRSRFLVADDDRTMARLVANILDEFADVKIVHTGTSAIAVLEQSVDFAFLWLDQSMPGCLGTVVAKRALDLECRAVCFIVTSYSSDENAFEALRVSAAFVPKSQILQKPLRPELIRREVIEKAWFLLDEGHPVVLPTCRELGLSELNVPLALGAANRTPVKQLASALGLSDSAWRSRVHRLLAQLGLPGQTLEEAGCLVRNQILERMKLPLEQQRAIYGPPPERWLADG